MRKYLTYSLAAVCSVFLLNVVAHCFVLRWDMTDDKRYSLNAASQQLLEDLDDEVTVTLYLSGDLNAGFRRLRESTLDLMRECDAYCGNWNVQNASQEEADRAGLKPVMIHERAQDGKTVQTMVYPYMSVRYKGRMQTISLLKNNRSLSGEENLNQSIEGLEYQLMEALESLSRRGVKKVAFLEGHGELSEPYVMDITIALSRYFQVDRGVLGNDAEVLNDYVAVIIADPQKPFSEKDKYILDHYVQRGGNLLWAVNGVRFSEDVLLENGFTPVIASDLNLTDIFFRYGIRLDAALLQDRQCLPIPVNVAGRGEEPNYQPMPWYYAPLLLTSQVSPITRGVTQVSSSFVSPIEIVGGEDGLRKEVILATSSSSCLTGAPAEVDLGDLNPDMESFRWQFVPVGVSVEGVFPSVFAHRMRPEGVIENEQKTEGCRSRQVFIGGGSIIRNETQQGQPLPVGYDRYSKMQFGNRDLIVNSILWMADEKGLMLLRQKEVMLRLLNDKRAHDERLKVQVVSTVVPVSILAIVGILTGVFRRRRYTR